MPKLVKGLKLLNQADACVQVLIQETGEHVLLTLGEVHLERCIKDLEETYAKIELNVSKPIVPFRETIVEFVTTSEENPEEEIHKEKEREKSVVVQTPNKMSTIKFLALPLPNEVTEYLDKNTDVFKALAKFSDSEDMSENLEKSLKEIREKLVDLFKNAKSEILKTDFVDKIWSIGPKKCGTNLLINDTDYENNNMWKRIADKSAKEDLRSNYDSSFVNGFQLATLAGPLADEPMQGVCFIVQQWTISDVTEEGATATSHGPFSGQIMSAVKEGCKRAFQSQHQRLVTPMYSCNITVSSDVLGKMYAAIGRRHGRILSADLIEGSGQFDVTALIPVIESFNFAKEIRKQTSGLAMPQLMFSNWEVRHR
jgi:ribosome assembly protein 1